MAGQNSTISAKPSYPINLRIAGKPCLVVGAGTVATRKVENLLNSGAQITVVAPEISDSIRAMAVQINERPYRQGEAGSYRLVITCTGIPSVNAQVHHDAEAAGVWVNSADDLANCTFTLPAIARQDSLTVAVSTDGVSPAVASWLARRFRSEFDERYTRLLALVSEVRAEAKAIHGTSELSGWIQALDDHLLALVADGDLGSARNKLRKALRIEAQL